MFWRIATAMFLYCAAVWAAPANAVDRVAAARAVQAAAAMKPGDDIVSDHRGRDIQVVDLDRDGVDEIVYHLTATCSGANFSCPNALKVMTALEPGDPRAMPSYPGSKINAYEDALLAAVRRSGYADDAGVQIPGEVEQILVSGNQVTVTLNVKLDSPICKRFVTTGEGRVATTHCPAPGRYRYVYAWTPGKLTRVGSLEQGSE
jgi:hypothetical protein